MQQAICTWFMSKKAYVGINGISKNVKNIYVGVNGVPKKVVKGYVGVNGVPKLFWTSKPDYQMDVSVTTSIRNAWQGGNTLDVGVATSIRNAGSGALNVTVTTSIRNYTP